MSRESEIEYDVRTTLHQYCDYFDSADFEAFAELFENGRWFMVSQPGSGPVRKWIADHVVLYDGSPLTRHEVTNLIVEPGRTRDEATFRCYVAIWQHVPERESRLLAHARFSGAFFDTSGRWQWREHAMNVDWAGDLSTHITGGLSPAAS